MFDKYNLIEFDYVYWQHDSKCIKRKLGKVQSSDEMSDTMVLV